MNREKPISGRRFVRLYVGDKYFLLNTKEHKGFHKVHKGKMGKMNIEDAFRKVLDCSFKIHTALGPGLLESVYVECLNYELIQSGMIVEKQKALPLVYGNVTLEAGYRIDLLVNGEIVIEVKSIDSLADIHMAQILTYLRLSKCNLGLLVNFNVAHLKDGIKRVIL